MMISSSCRMHVATLYGSKDFVGPQVSNGFSAGLQKIAQAGLHACVFTWLICSAHVRLRRPISSIHDKKDAKGQAQGFICRATRATTPDYIKAA
jgi:hypothetical protein